MKALALPLLLALHGAAMAAGVARVEVRVAPAGGQAAVAGANLILPRFAGPADALRANSLTPQLSPSLPAHLGPAAALGLTPAARTAVAAPTQLPFLVHGANAQVLTAPPAEGPVAPAGVLSALREHGALSGQVSEKGGSAEADSNFRAAAGLGKAVETHEGAVSVPADSPSSWGLGKLNPFGGKADKHDFKKWKPSKSDPLYAKLMERLTLDDRGSEREKAGLDRVVRRMLESPTARKFAQQFIDEGITGVVRFEEVEGSQVFEFERRKIFYAPRAFTDWKDGKAVVRLNRDYLDSDEEYFFEDAPPTLAHELLGHGLWYGRMAKVSLQDGFHVHENNETNAKLVGWLASWELNKRHHDTYAYEYLQDPQAYLENLKMRQPYYSVTYADKDLADPVATLKSRLAKVGPLREQFEKARANIATWSPIVEHFITHHGVPAERFAKLREDLAQREAAMGGELQTLAVIEDSLRQTVDYYESETGKPGVEFLRSMGQYPQFAALQADVDAMTAELRRMMTEETARPGSPPIQWPAGQITWEEFQAMFQKDARENPSHWVQK